MNRKLVSLLVIFLLWYGQGNAQNLACNLLSNNCAIDYTKDIFTESQIYISPAILYKSTRNNAPDANYKDNNSLSDCGIMNLPGCIADGSALTYSVYCPNANSYPCYSAKPLPVIFFFHGGGYSDCNSNDNADNIDEYCLAFAKKGYVVFNVNYRTGRLKDPNDKALTASQFLATYRAMQDARGAIRTAISRNESSFFRFDTNNLFIAGASSGAQIALHVAYISNQSMADELFADVSDVLGPINIDYYAGKTNIDFRIKGVLSLWGAVYLPSTGSPADFFNKNNFNPPLVTFQGMKDIVFLPGTSRVLLNKNSNYITDNKCLVYSKQRSYSYPTTLNTITQSGSSGFYEILNTLQRKVNCELYLDSDMGHGLDNRSDFGFGKGKISTDDLKIYIVERATTFFQSVINNTASRLITDNFQDCVNSRIKSCAPADLRDKNCNSSFTDAAIAAVQQPVNTWYNLLQLQKNIYINLRNIGLTKIYLTNSAGLVVKTITDDKQQIVIPCNDLQTGIYFLVVQQGPKTQRQKLFIP